MNETGRVAWKNRKRSKGYKEKDAEMKRNRCQGRDGVEGKSQAARSEKRRKRSWRKKRREEGVF